MMKFFEKIILFGKICTIILRKKILLFIKIYAVMFPLQRESSLIIYYIIIKHVLLYVYIYLVSVFLKRKIKI